MTFQRRAHFNCHYYLGDDQLLDRRCERVRHREPGTAGTPHPGPHGVSRHLGIDGRTARQCKPWYIEILIANALKVSSPVFAQKTN